MNEEIDYGPVIVTKGKYKGRIGCYDDDEDQYVYVYWGDMVSVLDSCVRIRKSSISGNITTYDLVNRTSFLSQKIAQLRAGQQYDDAIIDTYQEITDLYGEYVYCMNLLNKRYEETFYLQGKGEKNIFISHSSKDKQVALYIATDLKNANYNVWFDLWDLQLGHSIPEEISKGLDNADCLLMIVSRDYLELCFCSDEWQGFYMKQKNASKLIIPIIIDDSEIPTVIGARKYYRMKDWNNYDEMIEKLKYDLSRN